MWIIIFIFWFYALSRVRDEISMILLLIYMIAEVLILYSIKITNDNGHYINEVKGIRKTLKGNKNET